MRILVVAATEAEVAPLVARYGGARAGAASPHEIDILTTGVGMVATAARTARALAHNRYELALNLGVCGSFDRGLALGCVVHVVSDRIAELGAEDGDRFLSVEELLLPADHQFVNATPPASEALRRLPAVSGITVNTVHGNERSIAAVVRRFKPQVESMEGGAFMYSCLVHGIPFAQVRAVSNVVEKRNRDAWKMSEAIANLNSVALQILEQA
jgi:futalosine hydrolase